MDTRQQHQRHTGRHAVVIGLLAMILVAIPAAATAGQPSDPFIGSWRSVDFDGSNQLISFGGPGNVRRVVYLDDMGTICDGERFFAEGIGFVEGDTILTVLEQYCGNASVPFDELVLEFTFDAQTGTLTDGFDIVWSRP